jgi:hypothetical protein
MLNIITFVKIKKLKLWKIRTAIQIKINNSHT